MLQNTPPAFFSGKRRSSSRSGQSLVEYALILAFISVVATGVLFSMGLQVTGVFSTVNSQISMANTGGATPPAPPTPPRRGG